MNMANAFAAPEGMLPQVVIPEAAVEQFSAATPTPSMGPNGSIPAQEPISLQSQVARAGAGVGNPSLVDLGCDAGTARPQGSTSPAESVPGDHSPEPAAVDPVANIYFDPSRGGYQIPNVRGGWVFVKESGVVRELKLRGFSPKSPDPGVASAMEVALNKVQRSQDLSFSGPLAGYPVGFHHINSARVLVTEEAHLIQPVEGDWPFLDQLFRGMLDAEGFQQSPYLFGWLKIAYEALQDNKLRPGQAVVLAGARDVGKSLIQRYVITPILGGREARPYRYMRGGSEFNADLFGAEHLILEDESPSTDLRTRKTFGARIKEFVVNETQSCHPKGRSAITLSPFWRLTISLNDEPEDLLVLPPMDRSLEDKIMLFKATRPRLPDTHTEADRARLRTRIKAELPAFLHWLTNWQIPVELASGRFGVTHWHHPDLLHSLAVLSPEVRLLELIDTQAKIWTVIGPGGQPWEGTAEDLERNLIDGSGPTQRQCDKLLSFPRACATYLGRLADAYPNRVKQHRTAQHNRWRIFPPDCGGVEGDSAILGSPTPSL